MKLSKPQIESTIKKEKHRQIEANIDANQAIIVTRMTLMQVHVSEANMHQRGGHGSGGGGLNWFDIDIKLVIKLKQKVHKMSTQRGGPLK